MSGAEIAIALAEDRLRVLQRLDLSDVPAVTQVILELSAAARQVGIRALATPEVRALASIAASRIAASQLSGEGMLLPAFVLGRLARGRIVVPHYRDYAPSRLLFVPQSSVEGTLRAAAMAVADLVDTVAQFPEVRQHAKYAAFLQCVDTIADACRKLEFGSGVTAPNLTPLASSLAILPESPYTAEESAFIASVLTTDIIFEGLASAVDRVNARIACSEMAYAAAELYHAAKLARDMTQGFRLLLLMSAEMWLKIRPYVALPSALQSRAYARLRSGITEAQRRRHHIRWDEQESTTFAVAFDAVVAELAEAIDRWSDAHVRGATGYTPHEGAYPKTLEYIVQAPPLSGDK